MAIRIPAVCKWLLENSLEAVRRLESETESIIRLGNSKRLGLENVRLLVPKGILVFQAITDIRNTGEFLFAVRDGADTSPAYLSIVRTQKEGLNYAINACELLAYPWYSNLDSSKVLDRLARAKKQLYVSDLTPQRERHPLLYK